MELAGSKLRGIQPILVLPKEEIFVDPRKAYQC
jgi:hypothetical protein